MTSPGSSPKHAGNPASSGHTNVVLDANIHISALVLGGNPKRAFQLGITRRVDVAISEPIRAEVLRTLRDKFHWSEERLTDARSLIGIATKTVVPTMTLRVVERDPDDDRVLECAVAAKAEVIVTGDSDLLTLGVYEGIEIIQVAEFLSREKTARGGIGGDDVPTP